MIFAPFFQNQATQHNKSITATKPATKTTPCNTAHLVLDFLLRLDFRLVRSNTAEIKNNQFVIPHHHNKQGLVKTWSKQEQLVFHSFYLTLPCFILTAQFDFVIHTQLIQSQLKSMESLVTKLIKSLRHVTGIWFTRRIIVRSSLTS